MKRRTSVVIVERLPLLCEALVRLLEDLGADVVARCETLAAGIEYLKTLRPDLAVLDRDSTDRDAFKVIQALSGISPGTRIVLLSAHLDGLDIQHARRAGVCGYALKSDTLDELRRTMRDVLAGRVGFSRGIRQQLVDHIGPRSAGAGLSSRIEELTRREIQVLTHVAQGLSVKEVATLLNVSPKTVDAHKTSLMAKLDIHDRVLLAQYAVREGLASSWTGDRTERLAPGAAHDRSRPIAGPMQAHHGSRP